jgi:sirohydrochlorin cobaltochelatase
MGKLDDALGSALAEGRRQLGQVLISARDDGGFELRHRRDAGRAGLERFHRPADARIIAMNDEAGNFRPLKSAPTLRRGWLLVLADLTSLRLALDFFYPAALGAWLALREGRLRVTSLRETLSRQTGMYRVTGKISTAQADELAGEKCASSGGCLRTILWRIEDGGSAPASLPHEKSAIDFDQTGAGERVIPLLCGEICSLLVAAAREKVKAAANAG